MTQISATAERFLTARGLDMELAVTLGLRSEGDSGDVLVFPFARGGRDVGAKYRVLPKEKFWQTKGGVKCFWNEAVLSDDSLIGEPLVITEGELDAMAALQAGFRRVVSVPDGAPPPGERDADELKDSAKYAWLEPIRELLSVSRTPNGIILAVDGDENGAALQHDLSVLLGRARCKFVVYPKAKNAAARGRERSKDLGEVLEDYGVRGVSDCLGRAAWLRVDGVFAMSELPALPPSAIYDIDFGALGEHFRLRLGDFSVVTGIPGHGKTTLVNDMACRVAFKHGLRIAWASFEQAPQRDHRRAFRSWYHQMREVDLGPSEIRVADEWIDDAHRFIVPLEDEDITLDWMLDRMEGAVVQHGCKWLVLDPWNEMDHDRRRDESETEYTNRAIRTMKRFAKRFQVHITVVAHPTKMKRQDDGSYMEPSLYDIAGSAAWYNKPELGLVVHRAGDDTIVWTQKSRFHDLIGRPGKVKMAYNRDTRRFSVTERDSPLLDPNRPLL